MELSELQYNFTLKAFLSCLPPPTTSIPKAHEACEMQGEG